jgi:cytochrome b
MNTNVTEAHASGMGGATTTATRDSSTHASRPIRVWDLPVRVFHWALVASFGAAYVLSESERTRQIHVMFGYTVLGLIAFRLLWGFIGTRYARFSSFMYGPGAALRYVAGLARGAPEGYTGHNPAGSWAVYGILALGAATGITGYCTFNEIGGESLEEIHEVMANSWLVLVVLHVLGVIAGSIAHKENLARAMVTGYKQGHAAPGDAAGGSPSRTLVGLLAAAAVLAFWISSLLTGGIANGAAGAAGADGAVAQQPEGDDD